MLPEHWKDRGVTLVWYTGYSAPHTALADFKPGLLTDVWDLGVAAVMGTLPFLDTSNLVLEPKFGGVIATKGNGNLTETDFAPWLVIFGQASGPKAITESAFVRASTTVAGLMSVLCGRNIAHKRRFLNRIDLSTGSFNGAGDSIRNPFSLPPGRVSQSERDLFRLVGKRLDAIKPTELGRVLTSLRLFRDALEERDSTTAFLKLWIAVECIGLPDGTSIEPLCQLLARAEAIEPPEAKARFHLGRLFGLRSRLVHEGRPDQVDPDILDFAEHLYSMTLCAFLQVENRAAIAALGSLQALAGAKLNAALKSDGSKDSAEE